MEEPVRSASLAGAVGAAILVSQATAALAAEGGSHSPLAAFNFHYSASGPAGAQPTQVFDDGRRTYFQFSSQGATPTIYALEQGGRAVPVMARVQDPYMVVDTVLPEYRVARGDALAAVRRTDAAPPRAPTVFSPGQPAPAAVVARPASDLARQAHDLRQRVAADARHARAAELIAEAARLLEREAIEPAKAPNPVASALARPAPVGQGSAAGRGWLAPVHAEANVPVRPAAPWVMAAPPPATGGPAGGDAPVSPVPGVPPTMRRPIQPGAGMLAHAAGVGPIASDAPPPARNGTVQGASRQVTTRAGGAVATLRLADATPAAVPTLPEVEFAARSNQRFSEALAEFLRGHGWTMEWESGGDFLVKRAYAIRGRGIEQVLHAVLSDYQLSAVLYKGNSIAVITGPDQDHR